MANWEARSYLVNVLQQTGRDIRKAPVVRFVLRVLQQAVEPHHVGVGRAEAEAPVDLHPPSSPVFTRRTHRKRVCAMRKTLFYNILQFFCFNSFIYSEFFRTANIWYSLWSGSNESQWLRPDPDLSFWVQHYIEGTTGLLQPDLSSLQTAKGNHQDLKRPSRQRSLRGRRKMGVGG